MVKTVLLIIIDAIYNAWEKKLHILEVVSNKTIEWIAILSTGDSDLSWIEIDIKLFYIYLIYIKYFLFFFIMIWDYTDELDAIGHNIGQKSPDVIKD